MARVDKEFNGATNISRKDIELAAARDHIGLTPRKTIPNPVSDSNFPPLRPSRPLSVPLGDLVNKNMR